MDMDFSMKKSWKSHLEYSSYEIEQRRIFKNTVLKVCSKHKVKVYGSFCGNNFHLDNYLNISYSDIDCIEMNGDGEILTKSNLISNEILQLTGFNIFAHIRKKTLPLQDITFEERVFISQIDTLIKLLSNEYILNLGHLHYQISKLYLRLFNYKELYNGDLTELRKRSKDNVKNIIDVKLVGGYFDNDILGWIYTFFCENNLNNEIEIMYNIPTTKSLLLYWETNKNTLINQAEILKDLDFKIKKII